MYALQTPVCTYLYMQTSKLPLAAATLSNPILEIWNSGSLCSFFFLISLSATYNNLVFLNKKYCSMHYGLIWFILLIPVWRYYMHNYSSYKCSSNECLILIWHTKLFFSLNFGHVLQCYYFMIEHDYYPYSWVNQLMIYTNFITKVRGCLLDTQTLLSII